MEYAIIEEGIVTNIAVADYPIEDNWIVIDSVRVYIGDTYDGESFFHDGEKSLTEVERLRNENAELSELAQAAKILMGA